MAEEFEDRDLSEAVFWGVNLTGARFRDVDMTEVKISHARLVRVDIDAFVDRLVVNGVDVTDYVNQRDQWYPLRAMIAAPDPDGMRRAWTELESTWAGTVEKARSLGDGAVRASVDGEWSFLQTLRHLVFAMDKWFTVPVVGGHFHAMGMPNSGSVDFGWPGLDPAADPTLDEALAVRNQRSRAFRQYLDGLTASDLEREVEVLENGRVTIKDCVYTVLEEEFQHNRYASRDLARLS